MCEGGGVCLSLEYFGACIVKPSYCTQDMSVTHLDMPAKKLYIGLSALQRHAVESSCTRTLRLILIRQSN